MAPQLPLFPVLNVRRITLPEVVVPFPLGTPKTRVRQGVLGDVGDHSWEGCGTSPESLSTSSHPGFDNLSAPTSGTHESLHFPLGQPPADLDSALDQAAQRYPPTWRLQQRMVLPRQAPEMWRCRGSPGFGRTLSCLAQSPEPGPRGLNPTPFSLSREAGAQSRGGGGLPSSVHRVPLDAPPPHQCASAPAV